MERVGQTSKRNDGGEFVQDGEGDEVAGGGVAKGDEGRLEEARATDDPAVEAGTNASGACAALGSGYR